MTRPSNVDHGRVSFRFHGDTPVQLPAGTWAPLAHKSSMSCLWSDAVWLLESNFRKCWETCYCPWSGRTAADTTKTYTRAFLTSATDVCDQLLFPNTLSMLPKFIYQFLFHLMTLSVAQAMDLPRDWIINVQWAGKTVERSVVACFGKYNGRLKGMMSNTKTLRQVTLYLCRVSNRVPPEYRSVHYCFSHTLFNFIPSLSVRSHLTINGYMEKINSYD
jgi:hypothetical protein